MEEFKNLTAKILKFCEDEKASVMSEPRSDTERGFKIATILMTTKLKSLVLREESKIKNKEVVSNDSNHFTESLIKLLDDKLKEHSEEE